MCPGALSSLLPSSCIYVLQTCWPLCLSFLGSTVCGLSQSVCTCCCLCFQARPLDLCTVGFLFLSLICFLVITIPSMSLKPRDQALDAFVTGQPGVPAQLAFFFFNHLEFIKMSPSPLGLSSILHPHPTLHFSRIVPLNWLYLIYLVHLFSCLFLSLPLEDKFPESRPLSVLLSTVFLVLRKCLT